MGYFSEVARRRIAAVILIVAIVLVVLAVTDTAFFEDPPTPEEEVEAVVVDFYEAAGKQDFEHACDLLTKGAQDVMQRATARALGNPDEKIKCFAILESVFGDSLANVDIRIRKGTNIEGNRARVEVALKPADEPSTFRSTDLEQDEGGTGWLISDP
jgi:hypothetical protein